MPKEKAEKAGGSEPRRVGGIFVGEGGIVLDDLDRAILRELPDEGEKYGKYLPRTVQVNRLRQLVDPVITVGTYGSRLRLMAADGYAVKVGLNKRQAGWQRTAKGKLAAAHDEQEG